MAVCPVQVCADRLPDRRLNRPCGPHGKTSCLGSSRSTFHPTSGEPEPNRTRSPRGTWEKLWLPWGPIRVQLIHDARRRKRWEVRVEVGHLVLGGSGGSGLHDALEDDDLVVIRTGCQRAQGSDVGGHVLQVVGAPHRTGQVGPTLQHREVMITNMAAPLASQPISIHRDYEPNPSVPERQTFLLTGSRGRRLDLHFDTTSEKIDGNNGETLTTFTRNPNQNLHQLEPDRGIRRPSRHSPIPSVPRPVIPPFLSFPHPVSPPSRPDGSVVGKSFRSRKTSHHLQFLFLLLP